MLSVALLLVLFVVFQECLSTTFASKVGAENLKAGKNDFNEKELNARKAGIEMEGTRRAKEVTETEDEREIRERRERTAEKVEGEGMEDSEGRMGETKVMLRRQDMTQYDYGNYYEAGSPSTSTNLASKLAYHAGEGLRKLIGSNCVKIERGTVTPYYMCVGCKVEEAMGCIEDMRNNKSGNVRPTCRFNHVMEGNMENKMEQRQQIACCPIVNGLGLLDEFEGSAYPEAFRCLVNVGCDESTMYAQLQEECHGLCDYIPPSSNDTSATTGSYRSGTICMAGYAAAPRSVSLSIVTSLAIIASVSLWVSLGL